MSGRGPPASMCAADFEGCQAESLCSLAKKLKLFQSFSMTTALQRNTYLSSRAKSHRFLRGGTLGKGCLLAWEESLGGVGSPMRRSDLFPYSSSAKVTLDIEMNPGRINPRLTPIFTPFACTLITQGNPEIL